MTSSSSPSANSLPELLTTLLQPNGNLEALDRKQLEETCATLELAASRALADAKAVDEAKDMEAGDMEGVAVWKMILKAIKELLDTTPPGDPSAVH